MKILRSTIEASNNLLARLKSRQKLPVPAGFPKISLNLGCGLAIAPGWINIDGSINSLIASLPRFLHPVFYRLTGARAYYSRETYCHLLGENYFVHHELSAGIPFPDDTADYIFSSHFFEHLFHEQAIHLVYDSYRVLKEGGIIRISIPDLEYAVGLYQAGRKEEMLKQYFFVDDDENYFSRHKYMYDFEMLSKILSDAGFREIARCNYRQGRVPDIQILDNRPDESLFVEAIK